MAQAITFNGIAVAFIVAAIFASATVSAQDFAGAPAPAPGMDAGSAHSSGISGAVICRRWSWLQWLSSSIRF
uniref:Uncharacterized protein n=1 Tax=Vitis vinifera TaxID=29760 RepID=F6HBB8_VITVI